MNRMITMIMRRFLTKAVMTGMNRGIESMSSGQPSGQQQSKGQKETVKRARQSMRAMRRVSRF